MTGSAEDPWFDGRPPHIPAQSATLPRVCLMPGDPARVGMTEDLLDDYEEVGFNREFRLATGTFHGVEIAICSTGIGGPSTEIAVVELSRLGVDTFIRVGGMGALSEAISPGSLTVVASALRDSGAARFYCDDDRDIPAHPDVVHALDRAARQNDTVLRPIQVLSCDSYYIGEGRPLNGLETSAADRMKEVLDRGADAMDMECETMFAVARALGRRYGAVLATHGNRITNEWLRDYEPIQRRMLEVAVTAAAELVQER
jgi:uridine phosphorylase